MKKLLSLVAIIAFAFCLLPAANCYAQAPQEFTYQGVARDNVGNPLVSQSLGFRITIHSSTPTGTAVYQETHTTASNQFGLFNIKIGTGTVVAGSIATIDWGANEYFMRVELDSSGGTAYTDMGTSQLLSVPYALYAQAAGGLPTLDQAYDQGGAGAGRVITADGGAVHIGGQDGLLVTGNFGNGEPITTNSGALMVFNPRKAAFRAGFDQASLWADSIVGEYSTAIGYNTLASGSLAIALGYNSEASGINSFAVGNDATATGLGANAIGDNVYAKSLSETVIGSYNTDYTPGGTNSWVSSDRLFVIGNGANFNARSNAMVVLKNGNTGLGSSAPVRKLDVNGEIKSTGYTCYNTSTHNGNRFNFYWTGSSLQSWIDNVYVGTVQYTSDRRLKENINTLNTGAIERVMQLRPVTFNYKNIEGSIFTGDDVLHEGFIADELQAVIPSAVNGDKDALTKDGDIQPQTVNDMPVISVLTKAIQEQQAMIEAQQQQMEAQQKRIEELEKLIIKR